MVANHLDTDAFPTLDEGQMASLTKRELVPIWPNAGQCRRSNSGHSCRLQRRSTA
jgi:hypothetical protein